MATLRIPGLIGLLMVSGLGLVQAAPIYPANPFLTDKDIFVSVDGVIRLEHESLHPVWFALEGLDTEPPVVSREKVMVGTNAGMFALDIETGMMSWHIPSATALQSPAVSDGLAFVSGADGTIQAVSIADGKRRWRRSLKGALLTPVIIGPRLVVGGEAATLWALGREDGRSHWKLPLEHEVAMQPVADVDGQVYVCTLGAELISVDGETGKKTWQRALSAPGSVLVDGERLFVGQFNGEVSARDPETGQVLWQKSLPALGSVPLRILREALVVTTKSGENLFLDRASGEPIVPNREEAPEVPKPPGADPAQGEDVVVSAGQLSGPARWYEKGPL